ncbi:hypothetical protein SKAU_G00036420 [Synaphobranchus kaupii]|uniref:Uncharacterized protein n=1 Tax=Synaphobranchus kaupii TaxID=118154 RepID=A0A9Q1GEV1_SYNKA|nr:hypothetical protein SKAU_G00036420 [Synaphobranchus kaupii]
MRGSGSVTYRQQLDFGQGDDFNQAAPAHGSQCGGNKMTGRANGGKRGKGRTDGARRRKRGGCGDRGTGEVGIPEVSGEHPLPVSARSSRHKRGGRLLEAAEEEFVPERAEQWRARGHTEVRVQARLALSFAKQTLSQNDGVQQQ